VSDDAELAKLRPSDGARYLLERTGGEHDAVGMYRAWIIAPDAHYAYRVELSRGSESLMAQTTAPAALEKALRSFAKVLARDGAPWPARILRWRRAGLPDQSSSSS
jgi:hypothetical protein